MDHIKSLKLPKNYIIGLRSSSLANSTASSSESGLTELREIPQNFFGFSLRLVAVNFQPMWLSQLRHWAIVHAYLEICSHVVKLNISPFTIILPWKPTEFSGRGAHQRERLGLGQGQRLMHVTSGVDVGRLRTLLGHGEHVVLPSDRLAAPLAAQNLTLKNLENSISATKPGKRTRALV